MEEYSMARLRVIPTIMARNTSSAVYSIQIRFKGSNTNFLKVEQ
jgi:hypothetical protein